MSKVKSFISTKFKSLIGLNDKPAFIQAFFQSIDTNGDGLIDRSELIDWLIDEQFIDNPVHSLQYNNVSSMDELVNRVLLRFGGNQSTAQPSNPSITLSQFNHALKHKKSAEIEELCRSTLTINRSIKERAIRKVFDSIDLNGTGLLDWESVNVWLKYDAAYLSSVGIDSPLSNEDGRQALFDQLDRDRDGKVTFDDLNAYMQAWKVREIRCRTATMRRDAETRKMKRMAELLAATMASKLGLGTPEGARPIPAPKEPSVNNSLLRVSQSGSRPRSVSDLQMLPIPHHVTRKGAKPAKSQIARQIDELVLQSLALAAESSEINAKRRKLNIVNEKVDRELVACERQRMKLLSRIAEAEGAPVSSSPAHSSPTSHSPSSGDAHATRLQELDQNIAAQHHSLNELNARRSALVASLESLSQRRAECVGRLESTASAIPAADRFVATTEAATQKIHQSIDHVHAQGSDPSSAAQLVDEKITVENKLHELEHQVQQVRAQRDSLSAERQSIDQSLHELDHTIVAENERLHDVDILITKNKASTQALETERDHLRGVANRDRPSSPTQPTNPAELPHMREILQQVNNDREVMAAQLREMEHEHNQLTRRHVEISTALTNINQQISILFEGQIHERRGSFDIGDGATHHVELDETLPVPCVASVECEMDGRKTTGLLNVSNFIVMYESRIAGYVGRALPTSPGSQSPRSGDQSINQSRRQSLIAAPASDFGSDSCRFCVEISDVASVRFIHANDDDGHDEEGYDEEGVAPIEHAVKEPAIATLLIQLKPGFHNRFLTSDVEEHAEISALPTAINRPTSLSARPSINRPSARPSINRPSTHPGSLPSDQSRGALVACFGDYDSLRRVDKELRLSLSLYESKHVVGRHRASSLTAHSGTLSAEEDKFDVDIASCSDRPASPPEYTGEIDPSFVQGVSELASAVNLRRVLGLTRPFCGPTAWRLAYSTQQHGSSFPFFFNLLTEVSSSLLLISCNSQTRTSNVIGGFCGAPWENHIHSLNSSYYGNSDSFVFTFETSLDGVDHLYDSEVPAASLAEPASPSSDHGPVASSVVTDTMLKATHAVEAASAAGLAVAPAVRRASIDTTASLAGSSPNSAGSPLSQTITEVSHAPTTIKVYRGRQGDPRYMFSSSDAIGMGGASSSTVDVNDNECGAWRLDREFVHGLTEASPTFQSPALLSSHDFVCAGLEVWVPVIQRPASAASHPITQSANQSVHPTRQTFSIAVTPPVVISPTQSRNQ